MRPHEHPIPGKDVPVAVPSDAPSVFAYRCLVLIGLAAVAGWIFFGHDLVWGPGRIPGGHLEEILAHVSVAWTLPLVPALCGLAGFLAYRPPAPPPATVTPIHNRVCFRIVSRGDNTEALHATVASVRAQMDALPLFPYSIEVVTDVPVELERGPDLRAIVVPADYETSNGSRFKARALHYALTVSDLDDEAWILHLDEESHLTPSLVLGVRRAVEAEEASGELRIGQGVILYNRSLLRRPVLALADSIRTGEDLGRFSLQHRIGVTIFGLHGSFILVRSDVSKTVGYDFGPQGSVTEDAFWALRQMDEGTRSRPIEGYLVEQAPESIADFVRQRRRWFVGLVKVVRYAPVRVRFRAGLGLFVGIWSLAWIGILFTYVNLVLGLRVPGWIHIAGNLAFSTYLFTYLIGLKTNLDQHEPIGVPRAAALYLLQVILLPIFTLLEAAGVIYGIVKPETGFHVIRKTHHEAHSGIRSGGVPDGSSG